METIVHFGERKVICSFLSSFAGSRICNEKSFLGSMMFLAGVLSVVVLPAGSMADEWIVNGDFSAFWNISQYGFMPAIYVFVKILIIGMVLAIWGMFEKKN